MRFYKNTSTDPCFNLALEEYLFSGCEDEIFMLWRNDKTVVVGKHQHIPSEIDLDYVRKNNINVVRRITGGGAVYHDLGNVNFSYISQRADSFGDFLIFARPVIEFLNELGVNAEHIGKNDIGIDGKKVSGNAQHVSGPTILHHGTLLFDTDLSMLSKVLTPDPSKFLDKGIKSVRSRVCNISEYLDMGREEFWNKICGYFEHLPPVKDIDFEEVRRIAEEKYRSREWTFDTIAN